MTAESAPGRQASSGRPSGKVNILFVIIQTGLAGSERVVLDLAAHLDRSRFGIYVASFVRGTLEKAFSDACDEVVYIKKGRGLDPGAALRLASFIRSRAIHVVNAHHYMCFFYSSLACKVLTRRGLVYTEHSVPEVEGVVGVHGVLCRAFISRADAVVGVSKQIGDAFRAKYPAQVGKVRALVNGVDVERFRPHGVRQEMRALLGIGPDEFTVGMVANFRRVKNHVCLVRAFHRFTALCPSARLLLIGRGYPGDEENSEDEVEGLIEILGLGRRVVRAGYREDTPRILECLDLFCLPSFSEGLPVSLLEAMAAGVPAVGSDVRGIREVIMPGKTGLLFPSDDDHSLSRCLHTLMSNEGLRNTLREEAFSFVTAHHGLDGWISSYEKLFLSVCRRSAEPGKAGTREAYLNGAGDR